MQPPDDMIRTYTQMQQQQPQRICSSTEDRYIQHLHLNQTATVYWKENQTELTGIIIITSV